jgi:signal transduction histidine kinase/DNA-binding response OmpR family regulator
MMRLRFLLLEDNLLDAEMSAVMLMDAGIDFDSLRVETRTAFEQALATEPFDLILADYQLPGFDGLTALEMTRTCCPEVPFIFVTASMGEEQAIESLKKGATDYVLKQRMERLVPAVMRALREAQERRDRLQAERELRARKHQYIEQLQGLNRAALAINSALSVEQVLQVITDQAATIIGTHQSATSMTINQDWAQSINAIYLSDKYTQWRDYDAQPTGAGIYSHACKNNRPLRLTQTQLENHPHWNAFGREAANHPPLRGWLAAPLVARDGHNVGLIQLSDKLEGDFSEADETILVQLAQMASVAVENVQLYEAERQARITAEAAWKEAQTANRLKDEFLAVLSHELRSPLNPILGWVRLLRGGLLDPTRQAEALETIERNAKLQTQLIEDLLDISRIMQGKLTLTTAPVNLRFVIRAAIETVRLSAEAKQIVIDLNLPSTTADGASQEAAIILGDAARLQQVIWNLLTNAIKFTPIGGRVTVKLETVMDDGMRGGRDGKKAPSHSPTFPLSHPPTYAQITITDTGKGINPEFLPYVFDYFRQEDGSTTRKFGGLGLGLAIVRQLVELHGGTVTAESQGKNLGATFTVQLPIAQQAMTAIAHPLQTRIGSSKALDNLQILVVDDDIDTLRFQEFVLEQNGASVIAVPSGKEALQIFAQFTPDVLVSDIGMAEMDGYMLIQQVRALPPERGGTIPAIALTAYAGEKDCQRTIAAGYQQHVPKPIEPEELVEVITMLLGQRV